MVPQGNNTPTIATLMPDLLNPKDKITVQVVICDMPPDPMAKPVEITARIVGLEGIQVQYQQH